MVLTLSGIVTSVKLQPAKAPLPIAVTPLPRSALVTPVQSAKALLPMVLTLSGITMLVMPQPAKARLPMLVTPLPITMLLTSLI